MTDPCVERALRAMADDAMSSDVGITGFGVLTITDEQGRVQDMQEFKNILTTAGDQYYAKKIITAIAPAAPLAPTAVTGMKLGTNSATAASKSGAGAALVTYLSGANATFASGFPTAAANTGTDTGWIVTYQTVWSAASFSSTNLNEVVIVTDAGTNATSTAANTIARVVFGSTATKTSSQLATVTWSHTILGA